MQLVELENKNIQTLILAPTKELSQQIFNNRKDFAKYIPEISIGLLTVGTNVKSQVEKLKSGTQIINATPGRCLDLLEKNRSKLNCLKT